ncbi:hypothetical protein SODG_004616 [Sodalis praecaptivus]|uniref:hypothetical protein n=1 Tax=Sodalis praecaptivus TaxID=1239307 RepID=UPI00280B878A|nr:hypothetical protein [Sodalis praecaptivus]
MDPSDHAEPVWALPAHAKTPADLYRDAYPDKSLQGMGVWRYLFSLAQRRYYQKRKIVILCLTFCVLLSVALTFLFDGDTPLAARQNDNTEWNDYSTLSDTCSVNDNPILLHANRCISATGGLEDAYFTVTPAQHDNAYSHRQQKPATAVFLYEIEPSWISCQEKIK